MQKVILASSMVHFISDIPIRFSIKVMICMKYLIKISWVTTNKFSAKLTCLLKKWTQSQD